MMRLSDRYFMLFCFLYDWSRKASGKYESHTLNAIAMLSGVAILNICSAFIFTAAFTDWLNKLKPIPIWWALGLSLVVIVINYWLCATGGRATRLLEKYADVSRRHSQASYWILIGSAGLFALAWLALFAI